MKTQLRTSIVLPCQMRCTPRRFQSTLSTPASLRQGKSSLPTIPKCPEPTCPCALMPPGLDIDRSRPLDGTMAAYRHHAVVRTGVSDWTSKIEDDGRFPLVQTMRGRFGRGGAFHDPFNHTLLSASSHPSQDPSVLLFPSFQALTSPVLHASTSLQADSHTLGSQVDNMIAQYLFEPLGFRDKQVANANGLSDLTCSPISHLTVLICGHGARDSRCGIMGPLLEREFKNHLKRRGWRVDEAGEPACAMEAGLSNAGTATVELISHVGGHKFAGNVILYIPSAGDWAHHSLAGKGIWYGRVEPSHVDGIMTETVGNGVIIQELFRGGISNGGDIIRL